MLQICNLFVLPGLIIYGQVLFFIYFLNQGSIDPWGALKALQGVQGKDKAFYFFLHFLEMFYFLNEHFLMISSELYQI